jgi:hypothetical protein
VVKRPVHRFRPHPEKRPKNAVVPVPDRRPVSHAPSFNLDNPSWRISKIDMLHPFGWQDLDAVTLNEIRTKLAQFESMTWNEILVDSKKQNHSVAVWKLSKEAQERLNATGLGDAEEVVSLRLSGRERVWGLRQGAVMLILWWDPEHAVCPSLLKHT